MIATTTDLSACVSSVEGHFHQIFDELETMKALLLDHFDRGPVSAAAASAAIEPHTRRFMAEANIIGAGYVAARNALSDKDLYLAWWQGEEQQLLAESDAPATGAPLDYTRHPWFRTPERTGEPYLVGPYVDFVCSDEYVMTASVPVVSGGSMMGVVGADTLVETFERLVMQPLRSAGATVVNDLGRAVASADPHLATGTLIPLGGHREIIACSRLPLSVIRY